MQILHAYNPPPSLPAITDKDSMNSNLSTIYTDQNIANRPLRHSMFCYYISMDISFDHKAHSILINEIAM